MEDPRRSLRILLVDDEDAFRNSLAERLSLRGFLVTEAATGEEALRLARADRDLDMILLDYRMPGLDGADTLAELRRYRREVPVIMLTAHGTVDTAREMGKLGVFRFLSKPTPMDQLESVLREADLERTRALARRDTPLHKTRHRVARRQAAVLGTMVLAAVVLLLGAVLPPAPGLVRLVDLPRQAQRDGDPLAGYAHYRDLDPGESIADHFVARYRPPGIAEDAPDKARLVAGRTQLMIALIAVAAVLWATGLMPIGTTALLVAVVMNVGGVMRADAVAQAFAKDAVVFIFGVLALSRVLMSTGLDRRIAMLLLTPVRGVGTLLFVFLPLFALACSFISETVLVTLVMPMFLMVWRRMPEQEGRDLRPVLVMFALMVVFGANVGGPGSPAAGGRNAVMVGILADYGAAPSFLDWLRHGLLFVPVAALAVGAWFFAVFRRHVPPGTLDAAAIAREASDRLGPLTRDEKITAAVAAGVVALWIGSGSRLGMGAPVLAGLIVLNVSGVTNWKNLVKVPWDVVLLYGGASALGKGLAVSGGALFLADGFVTALPDRLLEGAALPMIVSLLTATVTNFMSDGATVAALGPITVPMAEAAGVHHWVVGFATAFGSSFAHMLIIGTPASALVYILCRDAGSGEHLVRRRDFLRHGFVVWILSLAVLWFWVFLGYWRWFGLFE